MAARTNGSPTFPIVLGRYSMSGFTSLRGENSHRPKHLISQEILLKLAHAKKKERAGLQLRATRANPTSILKVKRILFCLVGFAPTIKLSRRMRMTAVFELREPAFSFHQRRAMCSPSRRGRGRLPSAGSRANSDRTPSRRAMEREALSRGAHLPAPRSYFSRSGF